MLHCVESEEKFSVQFYILFFYVRKSSNLIIKVKKGFKKLCFDLDIDIQSSLSFTGTIFDGKRNICIDIHDDVHYFSHFELSHYLTLMNFRPSMLDNFALLSGQLNTLGKLLRNEKVPPLRNSILLPIALSGDRDPELEVKRFHLILMHRNAHNFNISCGAKFDRNRKFVNLSNSYLSLKEVHTVPTSSTCNGSNVLFTKLFCSVVDPCILSGFVNHNTITV